MRLILSLFLSLVVIYAGAGAAVFHYCCAQCEELGIEAIEGNGCHDQHHHQQSGCCHPDESACTAHNDCDAGHHCLATIDKVDLFFESEQTDLPAALILLAGYLVPGYYAAPLLETRMEQPWYVPPYPDTSRYYLNLYCLLLI